MPTLAAPPVAAAAATWSYGQAWLPALEPDFQPATVHFTWLRDALQVAATLHDRDIFNPATRFNEVAYPLGDVFELFVRPDGQETYFELHVTPHNQVMQLRWPRHVRQCPIPRTGTDAERLAPYFVWSPRVATTTRLDHAAHCWHVTMTLPFALIVEQGLMTPGRAWYLSCSRYDYTRGRERPVYSSTSPHELPDYHRLHEFRPLVYPG
jgi:hypothetical protein